MWVSARACSAQLGVNSARDVTDCQKCDGVSPLQGRRAAVLARCVCTPRRQVAVRNLVRLRASCSLSYVARRSAHRRVRVRAGTFYSVNDRSAWLPAVRAVKAREWHPQRCDGRERRPRLVRGLLDGRGRLKLGHEVRAPLECHRVRLETAARPASASTCGPKPKLCRRRPLGRGSCLEQPCRLPWFALHCARRCVNFAMAADDVSYEPDTMAPLCVQLFEARGP